MRKILELNEKHFLSGIAPSAQLQDRGIWSEALGIDPVHSLILGSSTPGLLQAGPTAVDIGGSDIIDTLCAWDTDVSTTSTANMYAMGNDGNIYKIPLTSDTPTITRYAPGIAAANGLFVMTHAVGGTFPYAFSKTGIFKIDMGAPSATSQTTSLQNTEWHPTHRFLDRVYFGNGRYIGTAEDEGSSAALTLDLTALDFAAEFRVNTISDDGMHLIAGITTVLSTDTLARGVSKIIFWDTNQASWQQEYTIPDAAILSIRKVGSTNIAVTSRGLFAFSFSTPPQQLLPYMSSANTPDYTLPTHAASDVIGEALLWGGSTLISSFGKVVPGVPNAFWQPYAGMTGSVTMVAASAKTTKLYVATNSDKLYLITAGGTTRQTSVSAKTVFIDLNRWYQVGRIVLEFDGQLATGDSINIDVQPDGSTSATDWGSAIYATHGAIRTKEMYGSIAARKLRLIVNFNGGAAKIRNITVYGDPIETPTHTRV